MTFVFYLIVAALTLFAFHRWVTPLSRRAAIVLLLLPLPFVGPALVTDRVYGGHDMLFLSQPWSDYAAEYGVTLPHNWYLLDQALALAPWQHAMRASLAQGEWPLWNPGMSSGDILAAGMQVAPYNPLNLLGLLLPIDLANTFSAAMIFFLAGVCTFAFARELECSEGASLVAALGFAFSGGVVFWVGWTPLSSWVLLPLVLLGVRRASFPLLTAAFALLILFGHPETMLHVVAVAGAYALFERRGIVRAIGAGVVALCLTAIFLLPFLEVLDKTWQFTLFREQSKQPFVFDSAASWRAIGATFIPYYGGASWYNLTRQWDFGMARVGSVILALAVVAAVQLWRRHEVRFFAVLAVVALLASWSALPILRKVPLLAVAKNERLGFAAAFALSMLAAMAFDECGRARPRARPGGPARPHIIIAVGVALVIATAALWPARLAFGVQPKVMLVGLAAEIAGIVLLVVPRKHAVAFVLAAIAVQRLAEDGGIYPALQRRQFYPPMPLLAKIPRDPLYRVVGTANLLIPNAASMYGLEDVRGYASMTYAPYKRTTPLWCPNSQRSYLEVTDLTLPFLSFLGVRHAITPKTMDPPPGWRVVADGRNTHLMENPGAIPRVFIPRNVRFIDDDETALTEMSAATDFAGQAWIHTANEPPRLVENGRAELRVRREGSRYEIDVEAHAPSRVVITDVAWPGWRAYLDGRRVDTEPANLAFLSVPVPVGRHHLRLIYLPASFVRGRAISFATMFVLAVTLIKRRRS